MEWFATWSHSPLRTFFCGITWNADVQAPSVAVDCKLLCHLGKPIVKVIKDNGISAIDGNLNKG